MALTELIGTELGTQTITIEQGPVRVFATAVRRRPRPLHRDGRRHAVDLAVRHELLGGLGARAPAGLPIDKLRGPGRMILHGEQEFEYRRPPQVGETLIGTGRISDVYEKDTSSATMEFYVREVDWRDATGEPVVTERFTLIVRARKG